MRSMTGFGRGEASNADGTLAFRVEISSVNRKQFELKFNLPRDMVSCEGLIRQAVAARISRGALTLRVEVVSAKNAPAGAALSINRANVRALVDQALDLNAEFDLGGALSLSEMLLVPGIVDQASIDFSLPENTAVLLQACSNALDKLIEMRETEGENLRKTLVSKIEHLSETVNQIEPLVKELPIQQRDRLMQKLKDAGLEIDLNDDRVLRELVIFADKCDVSEEITRLRSHFTHYLSFLNNKGDSLGRNMDFLTQEIFREINTLGNKAASVEVSPLIVQLKTEVEQIREQIQNIV
mgnify:CR=1 FL=1